MNTDRTTTERIKEMKAYTKEISHEISKLKMIGPYLGAYEGHAYSEKLFEWLENRLSSISVRAYFMRKVYEYYIAGNHISEGKIKDFSSQLFTVHLPFIWELIIIIQYFQNQIFDGKGGVYSQHAIRENIIAADKLKDLLFVYLEEFVPMDVALKSCVRKYINKIFTHVNDGQAYEAIFNSYTSFKDNAEFDQKQCKAILSGEVLHYLEAYDSILEDAKEHLLPEKQSYLDRYFYRIFLTNSTLFVLGAELIGILLGVPQLEVDKVCNFAAGYSLSLQIVNDNSDYIYKVLGKNGEACIGKHKEDVLCDLRNKVVTLPLVLHLGSPHLVGIPDLLKKVLSSLESNTEIQVFPGLILAEFMRTRAIDESIHIGRLIAQHSIHYLDKSNFRFKLLADMASIAKWNKFYYSHEKFKKILTNAGHMRYFHNLLSENREWLSHKNGHIPRVSLNNDLISDQLSLFEEFSVA